MLQVKIPKVTISPPKTPKVTISPPKTLGIPKVTISFPKDFSVEKLQPSHPRVIISTPSSDVIQSTIEHHPDGTSTVVDFIDEHDRRRKKSKVKKTRDADPFPPDGKGVIYIRVSTLKQVGPGHISLETQEGICRRWAIENKIPLYDDNPVLTLKNGVIADQGKSGTSMKDRLVLELITFLKPGDHIIVYDASRLVRDALTASLIEEILLEKKIFMDSVTQPASSVGPGSGKTPEAGFLRTIMNAMNEFEATKTSARVRLALEEKKIRGEVVGRVPFGYIAEKETKKLIPCPEELSIIYRIYVLRNVRMHVRRIKYDKMKELSYKDISNVLNSVGARCPCDKVNSLNERRGWREETVRDVYLRFNTEMQLGKIPIELKNFLELQTKKLQECFDLAWSIQLMYNEQSLAGYPLEAIRTSVLNTFGLGLPESIFERIQEKYFPFYIEQMLN